jgi:Zn-dependent protease
MFKIFLIFLSILAATIVFKSFIIGCLIITMLFFHECGHLRAAKHLSVNNKGIFFLPFMGAIGLIDCIPKNRGEEFFIAWCGPAFGFIFTVLLMSLSIIFGSHLLGMATVYSAIINLFNLLVPISPLDGGRIFKSISFSINRTFGLLLMIAGIAASIFIAYEGAYLFAIIAIFGIVDFTYEFMQNDKQKMNWLNIMYTTFATFIIKI